MKWRWTIRNHTFCKFATIGELVHALDLLKRHGMITEFEEKRVKKRLEKYHQNEHNPPEESKKERAII